MNDHRRIGQLLELKRWQEAHDLAVSSLAEIPQDAHLHFLHSLALHGLGQTKDGLAAIDRALALSHGTVRYHEQRGMFLSYLGKHKDAWATFDHALTLDPNDVNVKAAYVEAILRDRRSGKASNKDRLVKARDLADSILADAPETELAHAIDAKVHIANEMPFKAQAAAKRTLAINPNSVVGHQLMGITQRDIGNTRAAGDSFVTAGKLDPTSDTSRSLLSNLGKGGAAPLGLGAYFVFRAIAKAGSAGAESAGVPVAIIIVLLVVGFIVFQVHRNQERRRTATGQLSPQAQAVLEADKKLR